MSSCVPSSSGKKKTKGINELSGVTETKLIDQEKVLFEKFKDENGGKLDLSRWVDEKGELDASKIIFAQQSTNSMSCREWLVAQGEIDSLKSARVELKIDNKSESPFYVTDVCPYEYYFRGETICDYFPINTKSTNYTSYVNGSARSMSLTNLRPVANCKNSGYLEINLKFEIEQVNKEVAYQNNQTNIPQWLLDYLIAKVGSYIDGFQIEGRDIEAEARRLGVDFGKNTGHKLIDFKTEIFDDPNNGIAVKHLSQQSASVVTDMRNYFLGILEIDLEELKKNNPATNATPRSLFNEVLATRLAQGGLSSTGLDSSNEMKKFGGTTQQAQDNLQVSSCVIPAPANSIPHVDQNGVPDTSGVFGSQQLAWEYVENPRNQTDRKCEFYCLPDYEYKNGNCILHQITSVEQVIPANSNNTSVNNFSSSSMNSENNSSACADINNPLVTRWRITNDNTKVRLPIYNESQYNFDFTVCWGDNNNTVTHFSNADLSNGVEHTYSLPSGSSSIDVEVRVVGIVQRLGGCGFGRPSNKLVT